MPTETAPAPAPDTLPPAPSEIKVYNGKVKNLVVSQYKEGALQIGVEVETSLGVAGTGAYVVHARANDSIEPNYTGRVLLGLLEVTDATDISQVVGKPVRISLTEDGRIASFFHFLDDKRGFTFAICFAAREPAPEAPPPLTEPAGVNETAAPAGEEEVKVIDPASVEIIPPAPKPRKPARK